MGHQAGNELLARIARTIVGASRDTDRVFRYGGDEFAVILPATDGSGAAAAAERIRSALRRIALPGPAGGGGVTATIGIATFPADGPTADLVLLAADRACFVAKRGGRDRIATAEQGLALAGEFTLPSRPRSTRSPRAPRRRQRLAPRRPGGARATWRHDRPASRPAYDPAMDRQPPGPGRPAVHPRARSCTPDLAAAVPLRRVPAAERPTPRASARIAALLAAALLVAALPAACVPGATPGGATPTASGTTAGQGTASPVASDNRPFRPTPAPSPTFAAYTVRRGDTLIGLARRFGTTTESLAYWNRAAYPSLDPDSPAYDPDRIDAGWTLVYLPGVVVDPENLPPAPSGAASPGTATAEPFPTLPADGSAALVLHGPAGSPASRSPSSWRGRRRTRGAVVQWLAASGVPATVFVAGSLVAGDDPAVAAALARLAVAPDTLVLGSLGWDLRDPAGLAPAAVAEGLSRTEEVIVAGDGPDDRPLLPAGDRDRDARPPRRRRPGRLAVGDRLGRRPRRRGRRGGRRAVGGGHRRPGAGARPAAARSSGSTWGARRRSTPCAASSMGSPPTACRWPRWTSCSGSRRRPETPTRPGGAPARPGLQAAGLDDPVEELARPRLARRAEDLRRAGPPPGSGPASRKQTRFAMSRAKPISWVAMSIVMPARGELADDVEHLGDQLRVERARHLVEEQEVRAPSPAPARSPPAAAGRRTAGPGTRRACPASPKRPSSSSGLAPRPRPAAEPQRPCAGASVTLSSTLMCGNRLKDWKTIPIRRRIRFTSTPGAVISSPSTTIRPASIGSSRLMQRSSVDLPRARGADQADDLVLGDGEVDARAAPRACRTTCGGPRSQGTRGPGGRRAPAAHRRSRAPGAAGRGRRASR